MIKVGDTALQVCQYIIDYNCLIDYVNTIVYRPIKIGDRKM